MGAKNPKILARLKRKMRVRKKVKGTTERPRLCVNKTLKHIYAQLIDDTQGKTLVAVSTVMKDVKEEFVKENKFTRNIKAAKVIGELIAQKAMEKQIASVIFDRNGYQYHGIVKQIADSARSKGLQF